MERFVDRRFFLKLSGMSLAATVASPALARRLGSPRRRPEDLPGRGRPRPEAQTDTKTLLTIFLRGGADGLNSIVPTDAAEHAVYQSYRPTLQVTLGSMATAGTLLTDAGGASVNWGLNPRCASLMPLWDAGQVALLPDVHYDNGSRSHFDSQQYYENGTPGNKFTPDGWANRFLATTDTGAPLLRAVAFDNLTPFALQGSYPTLTFSDLNDLSVSFDANRNERYLSTQEVVYPLVVNGPQPYDREVSEAGKGLVDAIRWIQSVSPLPATSPAADPYYVVTGDPLYQRYGYFHNRLKDLAKLIKADVFNIELAEVDLYGWDTHNAQDAPFGDLNEVLARAIRAFVEDLGPGFMRNVVIQVVSEFGRTSRQNGSLGTDHGSATMVWIVGDASVVNGRRVFTNWAGLTNLRDNRDLRHSWDFRSVVAEILGRHMGNTSPDLFPGYTPSPIGFIA